MLLKATIKNISEWKSIINAIGDIVEEGMFICNLDGITFRGMDPSHITLLDITFPSTSFEEFECETSLFGIRINDFKTMLNGAGNSDTITLLIQDQTKMRVSIAGSLNMQYNLKLIEKTETNTPIPKLDLKTKVIMSSGTLSKIISNLNSISEFITINCQSNMVQFSGKGEIGDAKIDLANDDPDIQSIESSEDSMSVYSLEYMYHAIKNIGKETKNINFEYSNNNPIHLMFELPSSTKVNYYLAPKILN